MASSRRYQIRIKRSAAKEIEAIDRIGERRRIISRIYELGTNPRPPGCTKLAGRNAYRIRQGSFRIIYTVQDEELLVEVVRVGHRRDVYR